MHKVIHTIFSALIVKMTVFDRCLSFPLADDVGRCQDKKGSFTVETTAWEGTTAAITPSTSPATPTGSTQLQPTITHWHDGNETGYTQR
jgi:hypothetical protein